MKVWHYITKRSDDIQIGDYYIFEQGNEYDYVKPDNDKAGSGKFSPLVRISVEDIVLMRIKGKKLDFVWRAIQLSNRKSFSCKRVLGESIKSVSNYPKMM